MYGHDADVSKLGACPGGWIDIHERILTRCGDLATKVNRIKMPPGCSGRLWKYSLSGEAVLSDRPVLLRPRRARTAQGATGRP
jgi:hypothetical protein